MMEIKPDPLTQLRELFSEQLEWYQLFKELEAEGKVKASYIHNNVIGRFDMVTKGTFVAFLEILDNGYWVTKVKKNDAFADDHKPMEMK